MMKLTPFLIIASILLFGITCKKETKKEDDHCENYNFQMADGTIKIYLVNDTKFYTPEVLSDWSPECFNSTFETLSTGQRKLHVEGIASDNSTITLDLYSFAWDTLDSKQLYDTTYTGLDYLDTQNADQSFMNYSANNFPQHQIIQSDWTVKILSWNVVDQRVTLYCDFRFNRFGQGEVAGTSDTINIPY